MLRSPWFWVTVFLIVAGVALTAVLGVFSWLALTVAIAVLILDGILLYSAYVVGPAERPDLPELQVVEDEERVSVIYDCDLTMGRPFRDVGDGLALLYLLGEPRIHLRAVTTTYGDGPVSMTTDAARRLLRQIDLESIDVVRGAGGPDEDPRENPAAQRLVDVVDAQPGEIVVLATGAATNLKHALEMDPDFFKKLRALYLVGGVTGDLVWGGHRAVERHFSLDPEAAYRAIHAHCPTTIALGEAGLTAILRSQQLASLSTLVDPVSELILKQTRLWFGLMRLRFRDDGFPIWESVAALAMTHPECLEFERVHLPTTIDDLHTGRLVTDPDRAGPVRLVRRVKDYDDFLRFQFAAWHRLGESIQADK